MARAALTGFGPATRTWFTESFAAPTAAQAGAWKAISSGDNTLVIAPTGSGKTLSAFLWALDRLATTEPPETTTRVLYISPLKALGVDVERNLRAPLSGIRRTAEREGIAVRDLRVGVRSGDTPAAERRALIKNPPDILITTPESLFLMLTSSARETLRGVDTVIIDEIHAVASTKRGAHLALSLERLDALVPEPVQRIGLSATVRPEAEVARFLGGTAPVTIVKPVSQKKFDLRVIVPVPDMTDLPRYAVSEGPTEHGPLHTEDDGFIDLTADPDDRADPRSSGDLPGSERFSSTARSAEDLPEVDRPGSIWPFIEESVIERILEHRSTIVFVNSRRLAERLTAQLNEQYAARLGSAVPDLDTLLPPAQLVGGSGQTNGIDPEAPILARAHHGSVAKAQRAEIEDDLKTGRLRCVVATSSLELGIDMGEVDLVIQIESPPSVAAGLQRIGRAGHQVGEVSRGFLYPKHRSDLLSSAVSAERMLAGEIEQLRVPSNPLDILAQQTVAVCALEPIAVEDWFESVRRSAPFSALPRAAFDAVLDLVSGRYPSDEFAELRPRVVWDREDGTLTGRPGAQRLAVIAGGTIPDRGLFGVYLIGDGEGGTGSRVGELDEEMVYESRVGDVFALGTTSWKIREITHDRVIVTPAPGQPGRLPFWRGDGLGRPAALGKALGAFAREIAALESEPAATRLSAAGLDPFAIDNLRAYLAAQKEATGTLPTDRTLVVERTRDELGDWRIVLHSPYGMQVHAPWALAVGARLQERLGINGTPVASDDGIVLRLPDAEAEPPGADLFLFDPAELEEIVTAEVGSSALFASRFRESAARALLLPNYNPGKRAPLWQQRQRSAQLLDVARNYPTFPILLEAVRECLQDVYDVPALIDLAKRLESRSVRIAETETESASPYAAALLFGYVGAFMYEGDAPIAERRAAALSLDPQLLAELLGRVEMRELLDPDVLAQTEAELQRLDPERRLRGIEGTADLLRLLGPLRADEVAERLRPAEARQVTPGATVPGRAATGEAGAGAAVEAEAGSGTAPASGADSEVGADSEGEPTDPETPIVPPVSLTEAEGYLSELERTRRALPVPVRGIVHWIAIEDASRVRDALGVPLPPGVPTAFTEAVPDPLGDLIGRYARSHGPFRAGAVADRFGLGIAVVTHTLGRLADARRLVRGEFLPEVSIELEDPARAAEWCDAEVLRRLRLRSLAALRQEVEPVSPDTFARFLDDWHGLGGDLHGIDGVLSVVDQLAGLYLPASAWETLILPLRVRDYTPALLDRLTASGEVIWSGMGSLGARDGWVALHPADLAPYTLAAPPSEPDHGPEHAAVLDVLAGGGAFFFAQLQQALPEVSAARLDEVLWELVWAGLVAGDTLAPLRGFTAGRGAHKAAAPAPRARLNRSRLSRARSLGGAVPMNGAGAYGVPGGGARALGPGGAVSFRDEALADDDTGNESIGPRESGFSDVASDAEPEGTGLGERSSASGVSARRPVLPRRSTYGVPREGAPPHLSGRWSLLPEPIVDPTVRGAADAELLLERYGVLTRGSVMAEGAAGGFALAYRVLAEMESAGRVRRGYFIEGLGGAQFAQASSVDRLRRAILPDPNPAPPRVRTLAATDPANPFGAALPWPAAGAESPWPTPDAVPTGHRPGRKAGGLVTLVDGDLVLYLERGGKSLLTFTADPDRVALAAASLVALVRAGHVDKLAIEKFNGGSVHASPAALVLRAAGFSDTPKGLRIRRGIA
ncbi:Lhr family ATP-dependent helicase [Mycetocola lacteus]|uniref:Lhr family ATP-dependent helicase n=1 Tax=Mycetocola lacteus TaxID=76637 RepID=UPI001FE2A791|nr:DEAD/DEAH box helicase [Mycetocola lacteus]